MKKKLIFILLILWLLSGCSEKKGTDFRTINPQNDVYYEVFVRSFADSDNDGVGDLKGLTNNLDYFSDLGVTGLWLMPINESNSYHGYDIIDYLEINPDYGTMDDFERLVDEADKKDIKIMIDLVINHTSDQHEWYKQAEANNAAYRDYYIWQGETAFSSFVGGMVDLNLNNETVKSEIKSILDFYAEKGVKGFRLDAAKHFFQKPGVTAITLKNAFFIDEINQHLKQNYPDTFITAEVFEYNYQFNVDYFIGADSILDFSVAQIIQTRVGQGTNVHLFSSGLEKIFDAYREVDRDFVASPFITNHDLNRIASMSGFNGTDSLTRMKLAANVLLTLPGSPFIYYGDELGMKGVRYEGTNMPGYGVVYDEYRRSPFLWGDSNIQTHWLPSDGSNDQVKTVVDQLVDDTSLLNHYKTMIALRKSTPALMYGNDFNSWVGSKSYLQGYVREYTYEDFKQTVLVIHNLGISNQTIDVDYLKVLYGTLNLEPNQTLILEISSSEGYI